MHSMVLAVYIDGNKAGKQEHIVDMEEYEEPDKTRQNNRYKVAAFCVYVLFYKSYK